MLTLSRTRTKANMTPIPDDGAQSPVFSRSPGSHVRSISVDSNFDDEIPTLLCSGSVDALEAAINKSFSEEPRHSNYSAAAIKAEFKTYQASLPKPDELLQQRHSFAVLRARMDEMNVEPPRFLAYTQDGGVKPHHALCMLLLSEYQAGKKLTKRSFIYSKIVKILSCGCLYNQLNNPADFIRDQFYRVANAVPTDTVTPEVLRKKIRNVGLPVPNYFRDPEDPQQFPPHIALLVILQDGEEESRKLNSILGRFFFGFFAILALLLRIVLEVIGGAGAIWGGAEVVKLRTAENAELWRFLALGTGVFCFLRFITLNLPQEEDEGDILGPAGPWSLRFPVRLRAVCDHPFHYFVRALPPSSPKRKKET